jgi:hypothetical protein
MNASGSFDQKFRMDLQRFNDATPPADPPAGDPPANPPPTNPDPNQQTPPPAEPAKPNDPNTQEPPKDPVQNQDKAPEDPAANQPPENYEFKLPEGFAIAETDNEALNGFLKENKIPQEQAQRLVDMYVKSQQDAQERTIGDWQKATEAYLKTGREEKLQFAAKGLAVFDPDGSFSAFLDNTGLGENLEFLKRFEALGRKVAEGNFVEGAAAKGGNFLDNMYTTMKE